MKLLESQITAESLAQFGADAVQLLSRGDIDTLAIRYGYALSHGRDPANAIREDLRACLARIGSASLALGAEMTGPRVAFYKPDGSGFRAVVECLAPAGNGAVLVELVVTTSGTENHITLEDLTAA